MKIFLFLFSCLLFNQASQAKPLIDKWTNGLSGARLTSFSGSSVASSNPHSTLTVINFCKNNRYTYRKEGSWTIPNTAAGASNNTISGYWSITQQGLQTLLNYTTDKGVKGAFPIYLQTDGRVNIGGAAYAIEQGKSAC